MTIILIESALRAIAFAAVVRLALSILRVRNVPVRKAAWTLVLLASLSMPLLMRAVPARLGWTLPIAVPGSAAPFAASSLPAAAPAVMVPATAASAPTQIADTAAPPAATTAIDLAPAVVDAAASAPAPAPKFHLPPVQSFIFWTYVAVAAALLVRLFIGLAAALRLWITAAPVSPLIAPEPNVRSSSRITSPVNIGSGIVLPADYAQWPMRKLQMVLAHERSHVHQMDFYLQFLAGLYTAIFWFSPLGWWLRRTLSSLGEAIGDRAGLDAAVSRSRYAELVLEFALMPRRSLPGVAMAQTGNVSRRIERMLNEAWLQNAFAEGRRRALASLLILPVALFVVVALVRVPAAGAQSTPQQQMAPAAPAIPPQPTATGQSNPPEDQVLATDAVPQATAPAAPAPQTASAPQNPPVPPADQALPAAPAPPSPAKPSTTMAVLSNGNGVTVHGPHHYLINDGVTINGDGFHFSSNGDCYAIVQGPGDQFTFSGEWNSDIKAQIDQARRMTNAPFLWFTHDGKSYIVTDPAIIAQLESMYTPMQDLNLQQEALGKQQEALGKQQEALARDAEISIKVRLPDLSKEMADLNASMAKMKVEQLKLNTQQLADLEAKIKAETDQELTPQKLAELQRNLAAVQAQWNSQFTAQFDARMAELQARLGALEGEAGAREGQFGEQEGKLGEQQGKLGEQQGRLGEQQGKLAEDLDRQVQKIIRDTLNSGKAQPVH